MTNTEREDRVDALLRRHGRTFVEELGIDPVSGGVSASYRWLVAALLLHRDVDHRLAIRAARQLFARGWTTPDALAAAGRNVRDDVLADAGYPRHARAASRLGQVAEALADDHGGDLRRLREQAGRDPEAIRRALRGAAVPNAAIDRFFREMQQAWPELAPFVDEDAVGTARAFGIADDREGLLQLVPHRELPRLLAALVRARVDDDGATIRSAPPVGEEPSLTTTELEVLSRDQLYEVARARDVRGRSDMSKDELRRALS